MSAPLVSIIIPCYNAEKYVAEAIQSALDQTYSNKEVIVIDDGSTDGSLEIIKSFGDEIHWETGPNQGGNRARNRGLELSSGEWIKFLDADDILLQESIENQICFGITLKQGSIPYGKVLSLETRKIISNHVILSHDDSSDDAIRNLYMHNILTSCPLHKKSLLMEVGGFDENLRRDQEWNLHLRMAIHGIKFVYQNTNCYFYRNHKSPERINNKYDEWGRREGMKDKIHMALSLLSTKYGSSLPPCLNFSIYINYCRVLRVSYGQESIQNLIIMAKEAIYFFERSSFKKESFKRKLLSVISYYLLKSCIALNFFLSNAEKHN